MQSIPLKTDELNAIQIARRFSARFRLLSLIWPELPPAIRRDITYYPRRSLIALYGPERNLLNETAAEKEFQPIIELFKQANIGEIQKTLENPFSFLTESP